MSPINLLIKKIQSTILITLTLSLFSFSSMASQYPIVLVHGFNPGQLIDTSAQRVKSDADQYWADYWGAIAAERIDWPSSERVKAKIATQYVWPKLQKLSRESVCLSGCVFVTHSSGDLITRYIIENQANWLSSAGLKPLNIIATVDIAGAGGGSELADVAINVAQSDGILNAFAAAAVEAWLGGPIPSNLGVLNDLKVNNARKLAPNPDDRVPRLRVVTEGSMFYGITKIFLQGADDGVVASHSSCGSTTPGFFDSCRSNIGYDGELKSQTNPVKGLFSNHYPLLISDSYDHSTIRSNQALGTVSPLLNTVRLKNNKSVSVKSYEVEEGSWFFKKKYRYVESSQQTGMAELINKIVLK